MMGVSVHAFCQEVFTNVAFDNETRCSKIEDGAV
jgi:hypothetical protein